MLIALIIALVHQLNVYPHSDVGAETAADVHMC